jgi:hypothetical protein
MAEDQDEKDRNERHQPSADRDEPEQAHTSDKEESEGRDTPPLDRGRDPKSPWLGGG